MEAIEHAAFVSVGRAFGFTGLAIVCIVFSFSFAPPLAALIGGLLCMLAAAMFSLYGVTAPRRPYKRTETWLILPRDHRPPAAVAQKLIGGVLRETYLRFARDAMLFAVGLLIFALLLRLMGIEELSVGAGGAGDTSHLPTLPKDDSRQPINLNWRWRVYP